jgi:hypothetical protein
MSEKMVAMNEQQSYDTIIIGGGFYGLRIAQYLREKVGLKKVLVIEKESQVMSRASYNNQARVHNGYHYPRSVLTAIRSRVNLPIFTNEYPEVVVKDFTKYSLKYLLASSSVFSKGLTLPSRKHQVKQKSSSTHGRLKTFTRYKSMLSTRQSYVRLCSEN